MPSSNAYGEMAAWLKEEDGFTLIAHVSPDGDTLGSALALCMLLRGMGKNAQVVCDHIVPLQYSFLPGAEEIRKPEEVSATRNVIAIDCATEDRMGEAYGLLFSKAKHTGCIDHHLTADGFAEHYLHDTRAAATAELVYGLYKVLQAPIDALQKKEMATALFTAISTDTGNFAYSNTTPNTFHIAADLLELGIDLAEINRIVYRTVPIGKARLRGFVLNTMQLVADGKIGYAVIRLKDLEQTGAVVEDIEGMVESIRDVDTVEVAMVLRERSSGGYKASLRSKRYVDVAAIAAIFGGGGHLRAAGCEATGDPDVFLQALLKAAEEAIT